MSFLLSLIALGILFAFIASVVLYRTRRDRIEMTCVKESPLQTFLDEFVSNCIVALVIVLVVWITWSLALAFDRGIA